MPQKNSADDKDRIRIDKFLWCVRIYKSRTLAAEAVEGGKVKLGGERIKPSKYTGAGDVISVRQGYIKRTYKILGITEKRISAKLVPEYLLDITPEEDKLQNEIAQKSYIQRYKGKGRPTKKERRTIDKFQY